MILIATENISHLSEYKTACIFIKASLCILCRLCISYIIPVNVLKDITLDR